MKKLCFLLCALAATLSLHAQTLFTYGKNAVSVDEFMRAYNKNKTPVNDREKSLREYVDLYVNFKLKVQAAQDLPSTPLTRSGSTWPTSGPRLRKIT